MPLRCRLRTLLILLPPLVGLLGPRLQRIFSDWQMERAELAKWAELETILAQLVEDAAKRRSIRGSLLSDFYGESSPAAAEPAFSTIPECVFASARC